jgi:hypothetical protein
MCKLENGKKNQSFMSMDSCNIWNQISKKMKLNWIIKVVEGLPKLLRVFREGLA